MEKKENMPQGESSSLSESQLEKLEDFKKNILNFEKLKKERGAIKAEDTQKLIKFKKKIATAKRALSMNFDRFIEEEELKSKKEESITKIEADLDKLSSGDAGGNQDPDSVEKELLDIKEGDLFELKLDDPDLNKSGKYWILDQINDEGNGVKMFRFRSLVGKASFTKHSIDGLIAKKIDSVAERDSLEFLSKWEEYANDISGMVNETFTIDDLNNHKELLKTDKKSLDSEYEELIKKYEGVLSIDTVVTQDQLGKIQKTIDSEIKKCEDLINKKKESEGDATLSIIEKLFDSIEEEYGKLDTKLPDTEVELKELLEKTEGAKNQFIEKYNKIFDELSKQDKEEYKFTEYKALYDQWLGNMGSFNGYIENIRTKLEKIKESEEKVENADEIWKKLGPEEQDNHTMIALDALLYVFEERVKELNGLVEGADSSNADKLSKHISDTGLKLQEEVLHLIGKLNNAKLYEEQEYNGQKIKNRKEGIDKDLKDLLSKLKEKLGGKQEDEGEKKSLLDIMSQSSAGLLHAYLGNEKEAKDIASRIVEGDPEGSESKHKAAEILAELKDPNSKASAKKMMEAEKKDKWWKEAGILAGKLGDEKTAKECIKKLKKDSLVGAGYVALASGNAKELAKIALELIEKDVDSGKVLLARGKSIGVEYKTIQEVFYIDGKASLGFSDVNSEVACVIYANLEEKDLFLEKLDEVSENKISLLVDELIKDKKIEYVNLLAEKFGFEKIDVETKKPEKDEAKEEKKDKGKEKRGKEFNEGDEVLVRYTERGPNREIIEGEKPTIQGGWKIKEIKKGGEFSGKQVDVAIVRREKDGVEKEISLKTLEKLNGGSKSEFLKQGAKSFIKNLSISYLGIKGITETVKLFRQAWKIGDMKESFLRLSERGREQKAGLILRFHPEDLSEEEKEAGVMSLLELYEENKKRNDSDEPDNYTEALIKKLNEGLKQTKEGSEKGSLARKKVAVMLQLARKGEFEEEQVEKELKKLEKVYLTEKTNEMRTSFELINTFMIWGLRFFTFGGSSIAEVLARSANTTSKEAYRLFAGTRFLSGGIPDLADRYIKMRKEKLQKVEGEELENLNIWDTDNLKDKFQLDYKDIKSKSEKVGIINDFFLGGIREGLSNLGFKGKKYEQKTKKEKALLWSQSVGKVSKYLGYGLSAADPEIVHKLLSLFSDKDDLTIPEGGGKNKGESSNNFEPITKGQIDKINKPTAETLRNVLADKGQTVEQKEEILSQVAQMKGSKKVLEEIGLKEEDIENLKQGKSDDSVKNLIENSQQKGQSNKAVNEAADNIQNSQKNSGKAASEVEKAPGKTAISATKTQTGSVNIPGKGSTAVAPAGGNVNIESIPAAPKSGITDKEVADIIDDMKVWDKQAGGQSGLDVEVMDKIYPGNEIVLKDSKTKEIIERITVKEGDNWWNIVKNHGDSFKHSQLDSIEIYKGTGLEPGDLQSAGSPTLETSNIEAQNSPEEMKGAFAEEKIEVEPVKRKSAPFFESKPEDIRASEVSLAQAEAIQDYKNSPKTEQDIIENKPNTYITEEKPSSPVEPEVAKRIQADMPYTPENDVSTADHISEADRREIREEIQRLSKATSAEVPIPPRIEALKNANWGEIIERHKDISSLSSQDLNKEKIEKVFEFINKGVAGANKQSEAGFEEFKKSVAGVDDYLKGNFDKIEDIRAGVDNALIKDFGVADDATIFIEKITTADPSKIDLAHKKINEMIKNISQTDWNEQKQKDFISLATQKMNIDKFEMLFGKMAQSK